MTRRRWRSALRFVGVATIWVTLGASASALVVRGTDVPDQRFILLSAASYLLCAGTAIAVVLMLWVRHWWPVPVLLGLAVAQIVAYGPVFVGEQPPAGVTVHVMTQNLRIGRADSEQVVERVRSQRIDVLLLQELTGDELARLEADGLQQVLPFSFTDPREYAAGNGIWSRFPISLAAPLPATAPDGLSPPGGVTATLDLGSGRSIAVTGVHLAAPWPQDSRFWYDNITVIGDRMRSSSDQPSLIAGDFNGTLDTRHFRRQLTGGWRDGAEQAGAGFLRTWPADRTIPPFLELDHVLTRGMVTTSLEVVRTRGSDHLGLVATVVVPR